ncbi:MAG TPA: ribonuclease R [Gemmataceae bacterium]|jgi:ribonuclease R|nr:ribonuclease R [Gemmataceae bacterium]
MPDIAALILAALAKKSYQPMTAKALARKLGLAETSSREFRSALKALMREGKAVLGKNDTIRPAASLPRATGTFKRLKDGDGVVRVANAEGLPPHEYHVPDHLAGDAASGDEVEIAVRRKASRTNDGAAEVRTIVSRATRQFVGTYFERDGAGFVRVDGQIFTHSVAVADARVKGAKTNDKVVVEMIRFPTAMERGEGAVVEVLGRAGDPKVDTTAVVRALGIPDKFSEEALEEARTAAAAFDEQNLGGREDFTGQLVVSIDPADAKDFDDAVSLAKDADTGHWQLTVHIADVAHFITPGGAIDREARERGTSVYLPQRVIPMVPEIISNGLASLQEGKLRYVKTVAMEFAADGEPISATFANGAIRNRKRFTYEQVQAILEYRHGEIARGVAPDIVRMLQDMRSLSKILRARRSRRGSLEMSMPAAELEYDEKGHVSGAHFAVQDESHQLIEDFMLAANEAVASHFDRLKIPFLRRIHPAPDPRKLEAFATFARTLDYKLPRRPSRFDLQRVLGDSAKTNERHAVHYAMLRSLKQATYSPDQDEHFALASDHYCHFTSPIRRYPDLVVHRELGQWLAKGRVRMDLKELRNVAEHCSKTERRAESAEREAVKLRILLYLSDRLGQVLNAVITGVAEYGFFAQGTEFPAEGLVHVSSLGDDYYQFDADGHVLEGRRRGHRYRLGDAVSVEVARVDLQRRQLDFRIAERPRSRKHERHR